MTAETTWQPHDKDGRLTRQNDLPDAVFAFPGQPKEPLTDAGMCGTRSPGSTR